jgi:hypothetical protein
MTLTPTQMHARPPPGTMIRTFNARVLEKVQAALGNRPAVGPGLLVNVVDVILRTSEHLIPIERAYEVNWACKGERTWRK